MALIKIWWAVLLPLLAGQSAQNLNVGQQELEERAFVAAVAEPDSAKATAMWTAFMEKYGVSAPALCERAKRFNRRGQSERAMRDLEQARSLNCSRCKANIHYQAAWVLWTGREIDASLNQLELSSASLNRGNDVRAYDVQEYEIDEMKAWLYFEKRKYREASENVERAIQKSKAARLSRSAMLICLGEGRVAGEYAADALSTASRIDTELEGLVILGYFGFSDQGMSERAEQLLETARDIAVASQQKLPTLNYLSGDLSATDFYSTGTDDCKMTDVQCYLALRQLKAGRTKEPQEHLNWISKNGARDRISYKLAAAAMKGWPNRGDAASLHIERPNTLRSQDP